MVDFVDKRELKGPLPSLDEGSWIFELRGKSLHLVAWRPSPLLPIEEPEEGSVWNFLWAAIGMTPED